MLPPPTIRTVVANVEEASIFAERVRAETDRLKVTTSGDVTVLGDGAEWIWNLAADVLPQAAGVLDVYHAIEHIGTAVKAIWGDTAEATARRQAGVLAVVADGKVGIQRWIADAFGELPVGSSGDELRELASYLGSHPTRLSYAQRLANGRSIGSGLIEGSVKQLVNRRMKLTGARWRVEHVGPLVELAAVIDTPTGRTSGPLLEPCQLLQRHPIYFCKVLHALFRRVTFGRPPARMFAPGSRTGEGTREPVDPVRAGHAHRASRRPSATATRRARPRPTRWPARPVRMRPVATAGRESPAPGCPRIERPGFDPTFRPRSRPAFDPG